MKKTLSRGLPEGLALTVRDAIGITAIDATRAAALGRVLGWHLTVTGSYAPKRPTPRPRKGRTKRVKR